MNSIYIVVLCSNQIVYITTHHFWLSLSTCEITHYLSTLSKWVRPLIMLSLNHLKPTKGLDALSRVKLTGTSRVECTGSITLALKLGGSAPSSRPFWLATCVLNTGRKLCVDTSIHSYCYLFHFNLASFKYETIPLQSLMSH